MVSSIKLHYGFLKMKAFSFATHLLEYDTDLRYLGISRARKQQNNQNIYPPNYQWF